MQGDALVTTGSKGHLLLLDIPPLAPRRHDLFSYLSAYAPGDGTALPEMHNAVRTRRGLLIN